MYKIPEKNWGAFLSQGDTMWCWAYALGGIFGLTKHEEIAKLHETLGMERPDGTIADGASPEHVLIKAKEQGYIKGYKLLHYALKERRIQEIMKALEKGLPLYMQKKDNGEKTHQVRVIGFDEEKEQYLVIDSGKIDFSPLSISYDTCISLFSVEITPENYTKINENFKEETTEVKTEINNEPETENATEPKKMPFFDIHENDWYYDAVKSCYDKGIVNGKKEDFFDATAVVTRAEACAMIDRAIAYLKKK